MYFKIFWQKQAEKMAVKMVWGFIQRFPSLPQNFSQEQGVSSTFFARSSFLAAWSRPIGQKVGQKPSPRSAKKRSSRLQGLGKGRARAAPRPGKGPGKEGGGVRPAR